MDVDVVDEDSVNYITFAEQKIFFNFKEDNEPFNYQMLIHSITKCLVVEF